MGPYVNRHATTIAALVVGGAIVLLNIALIYASI
jgi:hypothetical protein